MMASGELRSSLKLDNEQIPTYAFPESAAKVLSKIAAYSDWRSQPLGMVPGFDDVDAASAKQTIQSVLKTRDGGWLTADECRSLLDAFKIPQPAGRVVRSADEAVTTASAIGFPPHRQAG